MRKDLYWLDESWPGKLAVSARPRAGDWLGDDVASWRRSGVSAVLSLLTPDEEKNLDLLGEAAEVRTQGMNFTSFPIPDRQIPRSDAKWIEVLETVSDALSTGKNVRGLVAACLLVKKGMSPGAAIESVSAARGVSIPETVEQRDWIDHYAVALTGTK